MRLILASRAPQRADILRRVAPAGMVVEVIPSGIDEKDPKYRRPDRATLATVSELTLRIARDKNFDVSWRVGPDAVVVSADSIVLFGNEMREKPQSTAQLQRYLESYCLSGGTATCVTSVVVRNTTTGWSGCTIDSGTVRFGRFTSREIDAMVRDPLFLNSAGGFLTEHPLMKDRIRIADGDDAETVLGMSGKLTALLIRVALED